MGKRTDGVFKRRKHDAYNTPAKHVLPLLPFLTRGTKFVEPCAGPGKLITALQDHGHQCVFASDINPRNDRRGPKYTYRDDARTLTRARVERLSREAPKVNITNPPWTRELLHPIILNLITIRPTWLLFDADWAHTVQAAEYIDKCAIIVSIGRVKWIPKSKHVGMDNAAWYFFPMRHTGGPVFVPRQEGQTS